MEAPKAAMTTSKQPAAIQMSESRSSLCRQRIGGPESFHSIDAMAAPTRASPQQVEEPKRGLAARLRGGGAGRVSGPCSSGV